MKMYPDFDLYNLYKRNIKDVFSLNIIDITKKRTLDLLNIGINCCDKWDNSLDIGGGTGHYSLPLINKFNKADIVEVNKLKEHIFIKNKFPSFDYHNDYIENISFERKFDFVLLMDIFEHIVNVSKLLEQISKIQDVGGVIYLTTPNQLFCGPATMSGIYYQRHENGHVKHYSTIEIVRLLSNFNYDLIYHCYEEGQLRQLTKRYTLSLSRRENKLNNIFLYKKIFSYIFLWFLLPVLNILESVVYNNEIKNKNNEERMMSSVYIFKKSK